MNENELRAKYAELEAKEQAVNVEIARIREKMAALEFKRERVKLKRYNVYAEYIKENGQMNDIQRESETQSSPPANKEQ